MARAIFFFIQFFVLFSTLCTQSALNSSTTNLITKDNVQGMLALMQQMLAFRNQTLASITFPRPMVAGQRRNTSGRAAVHRHGHGQEKLRGGHGHERYCKLLINELNTDSPKPPPSLFFELYRVYTKKTRRPTNLLVDQFILIIRAWPLAVTFYADLSDQQLHLKSEAEIFVVGDPGLPGLDDSGISLDNPAIRSIYKNKKSNRLLPSGDDSPYALLLLDAKSRRKDVIWVRLEQDAEGEYAPREFKPSELSRLKPLIVDMVVFGKKTHASHCEVFDNLWPDGFEVKPTSSYILRDWDVTGRPDYSLNRCTSSDLPFQIHTFQYDKPSPSLPNPCNGVSFIVEDVIDKIAPIGGADGEAVDMCSAGVPGVPPGQYERIDEKKLADYREKRMPDQCMDCDTGTTNTVDEAMEIAINNGEIVDQNGSPVAVKLKVANEFYPEMIELAVPYLPDNGALIKRKDIQQWIRVTEPGTADKPISFHCSVCMERYAQNRADIAMQEEITTTAGYFNTDKYTNAKKIRRHAEAMPHKDAVEYAYKVAQIKSEQDRVKLEEEYKRRYDQKLLPTVNMIRTVHTETLAEVPFMYHPYFVDMQESNGVNLGFHHYHDKAASVMTKTISDTMHATLLNHLIQKNAPFSPIVDATTSSVNVPYLITYFQTTEDGYPVTYFYRNIDLPKGESAAATFTAFMKAVNSDGKLVDGFLEYFKTKLHFFVSDNAAVMIGPKQSFLVLLKAELKRDVANVGCMAHKLSLVLKSALRVKDDTDLLFIKTFETNLNSLYIFYLSRGSKRLQHLADTAIKYGMHLLRFRKNIEVRWASGEYNVIHAILKNLKIVRSDLPAIQKDPEFTTSAKTQASNLFKMVTDRATVLLYHEFEDFLEINKILSEKLQQRAGILVDHYSDITATVESYRALSIAPGKSLKNFIEGCVCLGVCDLKKCTLALLEQCEVAVCDDDIPISSNIESTFKLTTARPIIYERLLTAIEKYFNIDLISAMIVLDNREFNTKLEGKERMAEFKKVCKFCKLDEPNCNQIGIYFFYLVEQLQQNPMYSQNFQSKPSLFWPMVLQNEGNMLQIPDILRDFLQIILVLSDSSAEAERGFSVLTRVDSGARSSLLPETLDAILRIKLNANKRSSKIDAFLYASKFAEKHYLVDDVCGGKQKKAEDDVYQSRASRLF